MTLAAVPGGTLSQIPSAKTPSKEMNHQSPCTTQTTGAPPGKTATGEAGCAGAGRLTLAQSRPNAGAAPITHEAATTPSATNPLRMKRIVHSLPGHATPARPIYRLSGAHHLAGADAVQLGFLVVTFVSLTGTLGSSRSAFVSRTGLLECHIASRFSSPAEDECLTFAVALPDVVGESGWLANHRARGLFLVGASGPPPPSVA